MTTPYASLTAAGRAAYTQALGDDAMIHTVVTMMDLSHHVLTSLSPQLIDGQVNLNTTDGPNKVLSAGFYDPDHTLRLDGDEPADGMQGLNRLIRVSELVFVEPLDDWVSVDVITARPTIIDRDGDTVTVEAQDKASLHLRKVPPFTLPKGANTVGQIKRCLAASGEIRFRFPTNFAYRLPKDVPVGGNDDRRHPWLQARRLARSIGCELIYNGTGYAWLRRPPATPSWKLIEQGDGANVLGRIKTSTDLSAIRNRIVVTGHTVQTKKVKSKPLAVTVLASPAHPFSAQKLAINGVPWYSVEYYDETDIHTEKDARAFANARLNEKLTQAVAVQCSAVPIWHMDPGDLWRLEASSATFNFRLTEASIPLGPSDEGMSIGYQQPVRRPAAGLVRR